MEPRPTLRLDKWLWQARFFKTRGLAAAIVSGGRVRVDGSPVSKPARAVGPGDVLTFPQGDAVRVVRILALGTRRGPAPEARALYEDLTTAAPDRGPPAAPAPRFDGGGRPSAKDRRDLSKHLGRGDAEGG
ncbi:RNA-binding S4 domain-containing protein [Histidinibacterium lentulum]|uniref:RNA-binding S4 domain-containing protein n=1 Tax=Histidinibacterium lentulum TaxID=2480588 RepID=A0A3N2R7A8_9RHOB|nr:RNA-binding S4 domain-containing protein [Histidinibacterium lentulum]ROU03334.1 RNA-binding S4 domain-containing protein [Histidinibacterium lentulum]